MTPTPSNELPKLEYYTYAQVDTILKHYKRGGVLKDKDGNISPIESVHSFCNSQSVHALIEEIEKRMSIALKGNPRSFSMEDQLSQLGGDIQELLEQLREARR